jgi:hypothetical protein
LRARYVRIYTGGNTVNGGGAIYEVETYSGQLARNAFNVGNNFSVTSEGDLFARNGTFSGNITATGGTIGGFTINASSLSGSGTITGGAIDGATVEGGTVRTAGPTSTRAQLSSTNSAFLDFYTSGTLRGYIGIATASSLLRVWATNSYGLDLKSDAGQRYEVTTTNADMQWECFPNTANNGGGKFWHDFSTKQWRMNLEGTDEFTLGRTGFLVPNVYSATTTAAANINVSTTGQLRRSTASSIRWKFDIEPFNNSEIIEDIEIIEFEGSEGNPRKGIPLKRTGKKQLGFSAENIAEILPVAAIMDEDGLPMSFDPNAMLALAIREIQSLRQRVASLEASSG